MGEHCGLHGGPCRQELSGFCPVAYYQQQDNSVPEHDCTDNDPRGFGELCKKCESWKRVQKFKRANSPRRGNPSWFDDPTFNPVEGI